MLKPEVTDLNTFLCNFETSAIAMDVTGETKALEITRCLVGTAIEFIQNLSIEERLDYEAIKRVLSCVSDILKAIIGSSSRQFEPDQVRVRNHWLIE